MPKRLAILTFTKAISTFLRTIELPRKFLALRARYSFSLLCRKKFSAVRKVLFSYTVRKSVLYPYMSNLVGAALPRLQNSVLPTHQRILMRWCVVIVLLSFISFSCLGCNFLSKIFQREMTEEKELFGEVYVFNPKVVELQRMLSEVGYGLGSLDGELGPRTRSAIREFQKDNKLNQTGYVDKKTWKELNEIYQARIDFFQKVNKRQVQISLKNAGFDPGPIDGKIGPKTEKAIREFQESKGLIQDGKISLETWKELKKYLSN